MFSILKAWDSEMIEPHGPSQSECLGEKPHRFGRASKPASTYEVGEK